MRTTNWAGFIFLVVMAGCNSGPPSMRVWGEITYDDKPISRGLIVFTPIDGTRGPSTGGEIKEGCYDVAATAGPLAGGTYRVEITALAKTGKTMSKKGKGDSEGPPLELFENYIPSAYNNQSTLKVTISEKQAENHHAFHLRKITPPPRS